jgi:glyceraldehyde-3-phosphate dehydrogenase/erythrose-4-phosphate dehydrogenase
VDLAAHVRADAGYVILSAPSKGDGVETIVHGVNTPHGDASIISCASCTTNCITPVMEILGQRIGVRKAVAPHAAIDRALRATEQAVRKSLGRRRMKPLRRRNSTPRRSQW